jgi:hypothetical protein
MRKPLLCLLLAVAGCTDEYTDDGYGNDQLPVANDDHIMLAEDHGLMLSSLRDNDVNVGIIEVLEMPEHGTIAGGNYTPYPGYFGPDRFTYKGKYTQYSSGVAQATVYVLIGSDGIAYEHSSLLADGNAHDLATGDVDGDGKIDLVTCNSQLNEMTVFRNTTTVEGNFSVDRYRFEGGAQPIRVALADLDGDSRVDVVTAAYDGLAIFRNVTAPQGPLAFAAPQRLGNFISYGVVVADIDGDGIQDLAALESAGTWTDGKLHVWLNRSSPGAFSFGTSTNFPTPSAPIRIVAVDADDDGRADLAVLGDEKLALFVNATSIGATVPAFAARIDRGTAPYPINLFVVDLDGDARREIGVLHKYGYLWIYANRTSGPQPPSFEAARVVEVPYYTAQVAPAELDGDGVIDLVGASGGDSPFSFLQNRSLPQSYDFELAEAKVADIATRKLAGFAEPTAMAFVDLDGVAPLEIVVASRYGGSGTGTAGLRVLFGP